MSYNEVDIESQFQEAVRNFRNLNIEINQDDFLNIYGLYKQSLFGDNNTPKPWFFMIKNNNKWFAWKNHYGKSKLQSKKEYADIIYNLKTDNYYLEI